jgi:DNA polymerase-3 subunit delta'
MIIGHQKQWQLLKKMAELKKFPHACLFTGQEKLGKRTLALKWVSMLFGEDVQKRQHPDLILIEPREKEIQISQIRDLIWKLSLKPYSASLKVAVLDKAHLMTKDSQTALLKTLEEPKGNTLLILITEFPEYLFPTILSRVQTLKFYPIKKEEIKNYLQSQGTSEKASEEISKISLGKPGRAIDFLSNSQKIKIFQEKLKEIDQISNAPLSFRFQYAKAVSQDPQSLRETLDVWLDYFRNLLLLKITRPKEINQYCLTKLSNILKQIQNTNFLISTTNVNPRLALETLMLEL